MFAAFELTVPSTVPSGFVALATANAVSIAAGALSYLAAVGALWVLAGRPEGGEHTILSRLGLVAWLRAEVG
jgi:hypothetical protein